MFLAHYTGWSREEILELPIRDLFWEVNEAVKLHNKLNAPPDE